jgi:stromal membrane-associated protein
VRSVNLDSWEPHWLEPLENVGNRIANDYYEYTMPTSSYKPKVGATLEELTKFVLDKYKKRNFAPKDYPTPYEEYLINKNKKR